MKFVLASYNGSATFGVSIGEAVSKLFPGFDVDLGDRVAVEGEVPGGGDGDTGADGSTPPTTAPSSGSSTVPTTTGGQTPEELLAEANRLFGEADAALQANDLGGYQTKVDQARQLVQQAFDVMQASTTSTPSSATPGSTVTASGSSSSAPPTTN